MGRELKCPICLSLFNTAVSLTCNHVFCNLCIEKSMKAASNCPVCKVPYRRREIRPAPRMDNLVSVYKSMEVASGVNIFVTQTEAPPSPSVQNNGQMKLEASDIGNQKQHHRRGSKSASVFPTKKRIQIQPYTRTEMEREKLKDEAAEINRNETKSNEEDMEKSTQQTDDNLVMNTPPEAPCFSDIKDLDDEIGAGNLSNNANFIDSEMFEWTQRPCSPELCSSPTIQVEDHTAEEDVTLKSVEANSTEAAVPKNRSTSTGGKRTRTESSEGKGRMRNSKKKVNANEPEKDKKAGRISTVTAGHAEFGNVIYQDMQEGNKDTPLVIKGKSRKGRKVLASVQEKNVLSDEVEHLANGKGEEFTQVSASENCGKSNEGRTKLRKHSEGDKNSKKPTQVPKSGSKEETDKSEIGKKCLDTEQDKGGKSPSSGKTAELSVKSMCKDNYDSKALGANEKNATRDHSFERDQSEIKTPAKVDKPPSLLGRHALLKWIMVHYVGGELVIGDTRKDAIHVHKKCAEWAPNVYFEDDTVVNLENELYRSRRIRCSCCGIKGAALGCYDKSCRKSFHAPCARLTPECRWDSVSIN
ncbi:hypothetical protein SASPL_124204 [Salvia splendens]|uniref:BRCA1-associated RING domain protein 1 n=1 Tax=Salvia splendens TaxID=180675 RepID=A0A8X8XMG3_SALSN|nr:hypothetical protein SASPL_124204 [Salvia splendens]